MKFYAVSVWENAAARTGMSEYTILCIKSFRYCIIVIIVLL